MSNRQDKLIHIFGDSFSENLWPGIVRKETYLPFNLHAKGGCTNDDILHSINENLDNILERDIVIIQTSGQGRLNVRDKVVYGDWIGKKYSQGFTDKERDIISDWYNKFYIPSILTEDKVLNSIIHLANHISKSNKVILWNLTKLGTYDVGNDNKGRLNDNVPSSPNIPDSDLWLPLSENGTKGWVEIIYERGLYVSEHDYHPNKQGNKFIADHMIKAIQENIKQTLL